MNNSLVYVSLHKSHMISRVKVFLNAKDAIEDAIAYVQEISEISPITEDDKHKLFEVLSTEKRVFLECSSEGDGISIYATEIN